MLKPRVTVVGVVRPGSKVQELGAYMGKLIIGKTKYLRGRLNVFLKTQGYIF